MIQHGKVNLIVVAYPFKEFDGLVGVLTVINVEIGCMGQKPAFIVSYFLKTEPG